MIFVREVLAPGPGTRSKATFRWRPFQSALSGSLFFIPSPLVEVMISLQAPRPCIATGKGRENGRQSNCLKNFYLPLPVPFQPLSHIIHDLPIVKVVVSFVIASWINLHFFIRESDLLKKVSGPIG